MKYELSMLMNTKTTRYNHERFEELLVRFCDGFKNPVVNGPRKLAYPVNGQNECIEYFYELDVKAVNGSYTESVAAIEGLCFIYGDCLRYLLVRVAK